MLYTIQYARFVIHSFNVFHILIQYLIWSVREPPIVGMLCRNKKSYIKLHDSNNATAGMDVT